MDPSEASWLGPILWAFQPFRTSQCASHVGPVHRAVGTAEIQTTPRAHEAYMGLVAQDTNPPAKPVRSLVQRVAGWTIGAG